MKKPTVMNTFDRRENTVVFYFTNTETLHQIHIRFLVLFIDHCSALFNRSQAKFVLIILVLSVFSNAIFRLIYFSSYLFDFSSSQTDENVAPSGH